MIKILHRFFYAWLFLTRLPAPPLPKASKEDWGRIAPYFTLIGFIIGLILYFFAKFLILNKIPFMFSALLVLLLWNLITGSLHMDGLMDTFDGIGCEDKSRKLEAMKDSRIGAFGAIGGIFVILFKLVSLCTLLLNKLFFVIVISTAIARLLTVYSFTFLRKNKDSGMSSSLLLLGVKKPKDFIINILTFVFFLITCGVGLSTIGGPAFGWILPLHFCTVIFILISVFICLFWTHWLDRHFKGHTGDTFGALIELTETTVLALGVVLRNYL